MSLRCPASMFRFLPRMSFYAALALSLIGLPRGAEAQAFLVVTTCGTVPQQFAVGSAGTITMDRNGTICTNSAGGGGGAVTIANGADVALGSTTDAAGGTGTQTAISIFKQLHLDVTGPIPTQAGTVSIGGVGQIGTWTIQPGNTANTTPWLVTGSGSAGTAAAGVLTVQGIASMTKLLVTPDSVALPANQSVNAAQFGGNNVVTGTGAGGNGIPRVTVSNDSSIIPVPTTSGGLTTFFVQPAASDNHTVIKNGAGQVYWVLAENNSATVNYLRLYNAGTGFNGCNSATNLVSQMQIPASTSVGGLNVALPFGLSFATGISICVTSGYATNDTTNATATAMSLTIGYN